MTKTRTHKGRAVLEVVAPATAPATAPQTAPEALANPPAPKSVVAPRFKREYQERARARGLTDKASKRGNGDWLQRELQAETIGPKGDFDLGRFEAILDANGVEHRHWNRTTRGWEGRVRMSGSVALRGIVGKTTKLRTPEQVIDVQAIAEGGDEAAAAFLAKWNR